MLCNRCLKEIPADQEIPIKSPVIVCKECSKEISARCHKCHYPIYKYDLIYQLSWSRDTDFHENMSVSIIQCRSCYKKWWKKVKEKNNLLTKKEWSIQFLMFLTSFCLTLLAVLLSQEPKKPGESWDLNILISFFYFIIICLQLFLFLMFNKKRYPK